MLDERRARCLFSVFDRLPSKGDGFFSFQLFLTVGQRSYLVDPASSHMLVSKIKPCMSKHKLLHSEAANGSLGHP